MNETLAPFLNTHQYCKTSLIRLERQGKLAVRLHGKTYKMFYCDACGTAHIEPYFTRSQLVELSYVRSCGGDQTDEWLYGATFQYLCEELEVSKNKEGYYAGNIFQRVWRILRGNRMTVKREFYVGTAHMWRMTPSRTLGREMEVFLENTPLCRHARKYHGREIQKLIQFAHCKAGKETSIDLDFDDVSKITGRYRTFGTWRLCWRPYCRTCVRFKIEKWTRWFDRHSLTVRCEMKRQMTVLKHVNSRRWRREILA